MPEQAPTRPRGPSPLGGIVLEAPLSTPLSGRGSPPFADREDAGRRLADELADRGVDADVVLAIPRGGLPLGRAVADELGLPLDVVVAKKVPAPANPELAIGAVTPDGSAWLNEDVIDRLGVDEDTVDALSSKSARQAEDKHGRYRPAGPEINLENKRVIVADDGVATGATTRACLRAVRSRGASRATLAVPVGPPDSMSELRSEADEVVCLEEPADFRAVGQHYERFDQVSDEEAIAILEENA